VRRLPDDLAAGAIVRTVLALGESLGMPVLAEGIETEAQWRFRLRQGPRLPVRQAREHRAVSGSGRNRRQVRARRCALFDMPRLAMAG
jgi:predicted signal transduction protein with EAL and GGDEF domain